MSSSSFHHQNSNSTNATTAPLWKWLLTPKLRSHLHENRIVSSSTMLHEQQNNSSNNSFLSREASLWKWRLKMKSIMMQGQSVVASSSSSSSGSQQNYYRSTAGNSHSSTTTTTTNAFLSSPTNNSKKKSDVRFAAKTLASNLISEIQSRTITLMMLNLTPLTRAAVGASRFDMMPESRLASLESLQRAITSCSTNQQSYLNEEFFHWKACMGSIMIPFNNNTATVLKTEDQKFTNNNNSETIPPLFSSNTTTTMTKTSPVVVPQKVFIEVGSRIGQLITLEETPNPEGVEESLKQFTTLAERDWATLSAQGGHKTQQKAIYYETPSSLVQKSVQGLSFVNWFNFVLLPIAVVMAPPVSNNNNTSTLGNNSEQQMIDHAVDFCSTLRKILFPTITEYYDENKTTTKDSDEVRKHNNCDHHHSSTLHHSSSNKKKLNNSNSTSTSLSNNVIHSSGTYEQRILPSGFYEPLPSPENNSSPSSSLLKKTRRTSPSPSPPSSNPALFAANSPNIYQQQSSSPTNNSRNNRPSTTTSGMASSSPTRKLPRVIQELVERRDHLGHQQHQRDDDSSPKKNNAERPSTAMLNIIQTQQFYQPFPRNTLRDGPNKNHNANNNSNNHDEREDTRAPIHLVTMDFSSARRAEHLFGKKSLENNQIPEKTSPSMPKNERQKIREEMKRQYLLQLEEKQNDCGPRNTQEGDESGLTRKTSTLGHMPKAEPTSSAFPVSVNPSPVRKLSPRQDDLSPNSTSGGGGVNDQRTPSPKRTGGISPNSKFSQNSSSSSSKHRRTSMIHSTARGSSGNFDNNIGDSSYYYSFRSPEQRKKDREEREMMKRNALTSTGRSFKNRAPRELNMMRLEGVGK